MSDAVYRAENDICKIQFMKYCKNNQTCIHENLFCDGHEQCEDGSDEDQEFCQNCPRYYFQLVCLNSKKGSIAINR